MRPRIRQLPKRLRLFKGDVSCGRITCPTTRIARILETMLPKCREAAIWFLEHKC